MDCRKEHHIRFMGHRKLLIQKHCPLHFESGSRQDGSEELDRMQTKKRAKTHIVPTDIKALLAGWNKPIRKT